MPNPEFVKPYFTRLRSPANFPLPESGRRGIHAMASEWQVGIDIGGTFTDVIALRPGSRDLRTAKVASRPEDSAEAIGAGLRAIGLEWRDVADLVLGTTMVTNAIIEGRLAPTALLATAGFSDTLVIARQNRRHLYRLDLPPKPPPLVPAERRFEVVERLDHTGSVLQPLDSASLEKAIEAIVGSGVQTVAVVLLHSYANPDHERAIGRRLREHVPFVALSHRVTPEAREYERMATTVLNASLMPLASSQLARLEERKPARCRLHLFHSAGGMVAPSVVRELPLGLALSGPAAGALAAAQLARMLDLGEAISFDMGGTTTDVCLISDGQARVHSDRMLGDRLIRQPMIAVESIGAGGGSIARLDHGALVVGPESAGADPGPACYGRGGERPTVSDADLVLGYLDAEQRLGDGPRLDAEAARKALSRLAREMGMGIEEAALGIVRVAHATMVRALNRITVEQGIDGRRCVLLAFGGAGPMHAVEVAREFGIRTVIVPAHSSVFSAFGCISAQLGHTRQQTLRMASDAWDHRRLEEVRRRLHAELAALLETADEDPLETLEVAQIRYRGQSYAVEVRNPPFEDPAALAAAFRTLHERLYGFSTDEPWQLESLRMTVTVPRRESLSKRPVSAPPRHPERTGRCHFEGFGAVVTPRRDRHALRAGVRLEGPLVVEDAFSTVVLPPDASLIPDAEGNLWIDTGGSR